MPPVMGAAAFVMAEITDIPYGEIVVAAAIGAVLYYFAILAAVHFEAKNAGMAPMPLNDIPAWREVLADAHLVIPDRPAGLADDGALERQLRRLLRDRRDGRASPLLRRAAGCAGATGPGQRWPMPG